MVFFKECLSCEGDDSSYFKDPNSEMQAEWTKRNDIIVFIVTGHVCVNSNYLFMVYVWRLFILVRV